MSRIITVELLIEEDVVGDEMLGQLEELAEATSECERWDGWVGFHEFADTADGRASKARLASPTTVCQLQAMGAHLSRNVIDGRWYASLHVGPQYLQSANVDLEVAVRALWSEWTKAGRPAFRTLDPQIVERAEQVAAELDLAHRNALRKISTRRRDDLFPPSQEQLDELVRLELAEWREPDKRYRPTEFGAVYVLPRIGSVG